MNMKKILLAVAVVAVSAIVASFFSAKIAAAIVLGSLFFRFIREGSEAGQGTLAAGHDEPRAVFDFLI